jgi:hypothetical protein
LADRHNSTLERGTTFGAIAGDFPVGSIYLRPFMASASIFQDSIFQQGKSCSLPDQGVRYQNTVFGDKACEKSPASP